MDTKNFMENTICSRGQSHSHESFVHSCFSWFKKDFSFTRITDALLGNVQPPLETSMTWQNFRKEQNEHQDENQVRSTCIYGAGRTEQ